MKKSICIPIFTTIFYGCSEVYQPDIENVEPFLVVEGYISTKPGICYVYLNTSQLFNDDAYFKGQKGATVLVRDDLGNEYKYDEIVSGVYRLNLAEGNAAIIGRTYTLHVTTAEGDIYESTAQTVVPSPLINNLFCNYDRETILSEDFYGDAIELTYDGINIMIECDGILPSNNYYMFSWKAYEEHHFAISPDPMTVFELYRHRSLSPKYSNIICTANADEYYKFQLRNNKVFSIVKEDMVNYTPSYDTGSYSLVSNRFEGLIINMNQKSISSDAYSFYSDVEKQFEAEGRLFDPVSPQLTGNISCTNNESNKVIGVFYAFDESEKIAYLFSNSENQTYSSILDSMPELWLDTCSWSQPDDWISPPI